LVIGEVSSIFLTPDDRFHMKYRRGRARQPAGVRTGGWMARRRRGKGVRRTDRSADADSHLSPVFRDEQGNLHLLI
jgi:hypothetical protein